MIILISLFVEANEMKAKSEAEINSIAQNVVDCLLGIDELKINKIFMYGSYARGDANEESDLDIMVLCDDNEENIDKKRCDINKISNRISLEHDIDVSVKIKDYKTFNEWIGVVPFYQNINNEGIVIYG